MYYVLAQLLVGRDVELAIGKQIQSARLRRGWTLGQLAKYSDVGKSYLSRLESGEFQNPTLGVLTKITQALGIPVTALLSDEGTGESGTTDATQDIPGVLEFAARALRDQEAARSREAESPHREVPPVVPEVQNVPVLGHVPAGSPLPAVDDAEEYFPLPLVLLRSLGVRNPYIVIVSGDSMTPELADGDLVLVDRDRPFESGRVIIGERDGEVLIKRAYTTGSDLSLVAANHDYAPLVVRPGELRLLGTVMKRIRFDDV